MDFEGDIFIPVGNEPTHLITPEQAVVYTAAYMLVSYMQRSQRQKRHLVAFMRRIRGTTRDFILFNMSMGSPQEGGVEVSVGGHRRMSLDGTSISDAFFDNVAVDA